LANDCGAAQASEERSTMKKAKKDGRLKEICYFFYALDFLDFRKKPNKPGNQIVA